MNALNGDVKLIGSAAIFGILVVAVGRSIVLDSGGLVCIHIVIVSAEASSLNALA